MKKNKKGFTLAELLIVVAIIGVLVAISIPIFTAQLKKARLATNKANARSALSAAMAEFIDAPEDAKVDTIAHWNKHMYFRYDTATGKCAYLGVSDTSPYKGKVYNSFANIGYKPNHNGLGISDVSKWNENTKSQVQVIGEKPQTVLLASSPTAFTAIGMLPCREMEHSLQLCVCGNERRVITDEGKTEQDSDRR